MDDVRGGTGRKASGATILEEFMAKFPTLYSPPDCDPETKKFLPTPRRQAFIEYAVNCAEQLVQDSDAGIPGLVRVRQALMEGPLYLFIGEANSKVLYDGLTIMGWEILVDVLENRFLKGCYDDWHRTMYETEGVPHFEESIEHMLERSPKEFFASNINWACQNIGGKLEKKAKNYPAAVSWYEKGLDMGRQMRADLVREREAALLWDLAETHNSTGDIHATLKYFNEGRVLSSQYQTKIRKEYKSFLNKINGPELSGTKGAPPLHCS